MPRSARIDIPNLLQHVIVRGIERRDIFLSDDDRWDFRNRLQKLLLEMDVDCLAWSLMSNHFHLLLRPTRTPLAPFMRRLLTGYAVSFNLRHNRSGHLFQNRYKSIVCDEDSYLLELVRYIHLNPLRAGIVADLGALDTFPWSGHAMLMGKIVLEGQGINEVLRYFGPGVSASRRTYREFMADGVLQGERPDLVGKRSGASGGGCPASDRRILGDENFVEQLKTEECLHQQLRRPMSIESIVATIADQYGVAPKAIASKSRLPRTLDARAVVCYTAVEEGHTGAEVGRVLGMTRSGVAIARRRGEEVLARIESTAEFQHDTRLDSTN
ncbi:transposase [Geobacter sulfurreducens]|uniref:Transposase, Y1_Tnp domain-containing n=1 Tax=Geobacter sulfurreducens (strain ATCC 51573 / DSM 12127 / PCA) TaxID=243231 RepID=Q74EK8_GEOSL|nr:transposase [Geobacter sulfurreducens]AAR34281.1 transposase, Y1_Tnp domain-containing [Geobacter sulfurreducens PCA]ADN78328.1 transposase, Y1_Tnp domain-containing [Geobacter sulfurreducens KN400]UAC05010.1 transposase [Geobacter sulfurreducens]HBB69545.1 transposase [Geobacter sulfurreducens]HCD96703.1 transposase [Geobacter sulfurreducens]